MTYEITANDLANYERTNEYNPGKSNPFAAVSDSDIDDGNGGTTPSNPSGGNSSNGNSGGSLFENGSSK